MEALNKNHLFSLALYSIEYRKNMQLHTGNILQLQHTAF